MVTIPLSKPMEFLTVGYTPLSIYCPGRVLSLCLLVRVLGTSVVAWEYD
jgi:hypothetical protein